MSAIVLNYLTTQARNGRPYSALLLGRELLRGSPLQRAFVSHLVREGLVNRATASALDINPAEIRALKTLARRERSRHLASRHTFSPTPVRRPSVGRRIGVR